MRSRGRCSGIGRRARLRRSNDGTAIFSVAICTVVSACAAIAPGRRAVARSGLALRLAQRTVELLVPELPDRELELLD
jgi:hypothetical protein